jgi:hypothetical protein
MQSNTPAASGQDADPATASTLPPPLHICSCCCRVIDHQTWAKLPYVGLQDDGDGGWLELRNDVCGSTIARPATKPVRGFEVA